MKRIKQLIKPSILSMSAYRVPPAAGDIKLDAMENPYIWPAGLRQQWLSTLEAVEINRYPASSAETLKEVMRESLSIPDNAALMLGNGSDELIQILALAVSGSDRVFMAPEPGFVMYRQISSTVDAAFISVPLDSANFSLDRQKILTAIRHHQPVLIFLAWPNNPTGNFFDKNLMLEIIEEAPGLVVIDEAYYAFSGSSFAGYLRKYNNLLVMRTLSKSGLAGLRLGYLMGPEGLLSELEKIRLPYNINSLTQKTAEFILNHHGVLEAQAARICADRDALFSMLENLPGVSVWPSAANFLLFRTLDRPAQQVFERLRQKRVLIKNLHNSHPLLNNCLRVTIGRADENSRFMEALVESL